MAVSREFLLTRRALLPGNPSEEVAVGLCRRPVTAVANSRRGASPAARRFAVGADETG